MLGPHTLRITHSAKIPPLHTCPSPPSCPVGLRWSLSPLNGHGRIEQFSPPCSTTRGAGGRLWAYVCAKVRSIVPPYTIAQPLQAVKCNHKRGAPGYDVFQQRSYYSFLYIR